MPRAFCAKTPGNWIHGFIGNYGWSIIALTVLINLIMWPLRHKSMVSMRKMQEIQPIVKSIQDRYAHLKMTDPGKQKMNEEMMRLYKEKGVNPASGCVPMLIERAHVHRRPPLACLRHRPRRGL